VDACQNDIAGKNALEIYKFYNFVADKNVLMMNNSLLRELLEEKYLKVNNHDFITTDPLQVPHMYTDRCDIKIAAI
jgi:hypothetical protein